MNTRDTSRATSAPQTALQRGGAALVAALVTFAMGLWVLLVGARLGGVPASALPMNAGVYSLALLGVIFAARLVLWWRYRPLPTPDDLWERLPPITVVVPAFNEGATVARCVDHLVASRYPPDRLQIIVVNDGSTDDTGAHMDEAAAAHPGRVVAIHLGHNQGKRHALLAGFARSTGELIGTVDSDSMVRPEALSQMAIPFLIGAPVAGVAGRVLAANRRANLLTRLLGVRYILGFDFVRAYQSALRTVWCCPGALQLYRRSVVAPHLDGWANQRFLGARCTNGDDHCMTNLVLSLGWDTVYQSTAVVDTVVPHRYGGLCRMYTRWGRSATREGLRALRFAWGRAIRLGPIRGGLMLADALMQPLTIAARVLGIVLGGWLIWRRPDLALLGLVAATFVGVVYSLLFLRSERSAAALLTIVYAWYALVALFWVQPWATLTVRSNRWLTRGPGLPPAPPMG